MEKIQITFLGTGSAIPTITRNHTSIFLKYKNSDILIDCGEGTQRQIRKAKINPCKITNLLITHFHGDHIFGLPGLLHTLYKNEYNKTLNIYGPKGTRELIKKILEFTGAKIKINFKEVSGKFINNPDFSIITLPLEHDTPCNGYIFQEKDKLRIDKKKLKKLKNIAGYQIGLLAKKRNVKIKNKIIRWKDFTYLEKGRKISFVFDTKMCDNVNKLIRNSDLAIIESSFLDEDKELAIKYKHLTLEEATKAAKKEKVKQLFLTHISQRYEFKEKYLLKKARKIFKNAKIAEDLMKAEI